VVSPDGHTTFGRVESFSGAASGRDNTWAGPGARAGWTCWRGFLPRRRAWSEVWRRGDVGEQLLASFPWNGAPGNVVGGVERTGCCEDTGRTNSCTR